MGLASKKTGMQKYSQLPHITQISNMCVAQHFDLETEEEFFQPESLHIDQKEARYPDIFVNNYTVVNYFPSELLPGYSTDNSCTLKTV